MIMLLLKLLFRNVPRIAFVNRARIGHDIAEPGGNAYLPID
jgi:hypothetical protein